MSRPHLGRFDMNRENDHRIHDPPVEERVVGKFTTEYGTDEL